MILEAATAHRQHTVGGLTVPYSMDTNNSKLSHGNSPTPAGQPDLSSGLTRFPVQIPIPHLSSMSSALARYESFLIQNVSTIYSLESTLRSISWLLPGRFKDAELVSEAR